MEDLLSYDTSLSVLADRKGWKYKEYKVSLGYVSVEARPINA
jgi:hypothetical protein